MTHPCPQCGRPASLAPDTLKAELGHFALLGPHYANVGTLFDQGVCASCCVTAIILGCLAEERDRLVEKARADARRGKQRRHILRLAIEQRGLCAICGDLLWTGDPAGMAVVELEASQIHADHITPSSKGGATEHANLRAVHAHCNLSRGTKDY